jgi:hypothetical protein
VLEVVERLPVWRRREVRVEVDAARKDQPAAGVDLGGGRTNFADD